MHPDYDKLYVTVKADRLDELTSYYGRLGWERVEVKEHKIYLDELNLAFRRPHFVEHKDELQLMQVYLDEALNGLAKMRARPCPYSTAFCVIFSLLSVAAIITGLCLALVRGGNWFYGGLCISACGGALALATLITSIIAFRREKRAELEYAEKLRETIKNVLQAADAFGGDESD